MRLSLPEVTNDGDDAKPHRSPEGQDDDEPCDDEPDETAHVVPLQSAEAVTENFAFPFSLLGRVDRILDDPCLPYGPVFI